MDRVYSYSDYEYAYYNSQYYKLKKIGVYLLSLIQNNRAKELSEKLSQSEWNQDLPEDEKKQLLQLYFDVKVWIMIYENYY